MEVRYLKARTCHFFVAVYYHCGVECDNCNKVIVGARYKCWWVTALSSIIKDAATVKIAHCSIFHFWTIVKQYFLFSNCVDYDLCEECENISGVHDHTHVFIKLRRPIKFRQRGPLMKQILYKMYRPPSSAEESTEKEEMEETVRSGKEGKILAKIEK